MNLTKQTILNVLKETGKREAFYTEFETQYNNAGMPFGKDLNAIFVNALRSTSPDLNLLINAGQTITNGTVNAVLAKLDPS